MAVDYHNIRHTYNIRLNGRSICLKWCHVITDIVSDYFDPVSCLDKVFLLYIRRRNVFSVINILNNRDLFDYSLTASFATVIHRQRHPTSTVVARQSLYKAACN